jgi:hypothetical protein
MVDSLRSDLVNRGADNVFANQGDGNGNNNNIERIDYIFNAGFPYYNFTDQRGFLVMDRGGNDRFKIAVIIAVGTNGCPRRSAGRSRCWTPIGARRASRWKPR